MSHVQAHSPEEKAVVIEDAAVRILATLDWHRRRRFMPQSQLKRWAHMVRTALA